MSTIRAESNRLRLAFRSALALVLVAPQGCSSSEPAPVTPPVAEAGTPDAAIVDAGVDARCDTAGFVPDPPDLCGDYVRFPCGLPPSVVPRGNCYLTVGDCASICPDIQFNCRVIETY